jgi:hypothetical protein
MGNDEIITLVCVGVIVVLPIVVGLIALAVFMYKRGGSGGGIDNDGTPYD